jgi:hypothetical protein
MARDWAIFGSVRGGGDPAPQPERQRDETPLTSDCRHSAGTWCTHCQPWMQAAADGRL